MDIRRLDSGQEGFEQELEHLLAWESVSDDAVFSFAYSEDITKYNIYW